MRDRDLGIACNGVLHLGQVQCDSSSMRWGVRRRFR